jgi:hypothetical protein
MSGFEVLLWTIPVLFGLSLLFAILLWCRGWRREDRWEMDRRLKLLTAQVTKLSEVVENLEKIHAAARTADNRLSEQLTALSADVSRLLAGRSPASPSPPTPHLSSPADAPTDSADRYERAREMLSSGTDPVEVARHLDISLGDIHVIQRMMNLKPKG